MHTIFFAAVERYHLFSAVTTFLRRAVHTVACQQTSASRHHHHHETITSRNKHNLQSLFLADDEKTAVL